MAGKKTKKKGKKKAAPRWILPTLAVLVALVGSIVFWMNYVVPQEQKIIYPLRYQKELLGAAEEFGIDPCMLAALVYCESSFRPDAVSAVGAIGLTQIMPKTGEWLASKIELRDPYSVESLYDPETNLRLSSWYLHYLIDRYDGRLTEALTAYIAGQGKVDEWLKNPELSGDGKTLDVIPGQDAKEYAAKVMMTHEKYKAVYPDVFICTLDPDNGRVSEE